MCRSGCPTQDCGSYAACLKGMNIRVAYCNSASGSDYTDQKKFDANLDAYRAARAQGVQPANSTPAAIKRAMAISEVTGKAYTAQ